MTQLDFKWFRGRRLAAIDRVAKCFQCRKPIGKKLGYDYGRRGCACKRCHGRAFRRSRGGRAGGTAGGGER